MTPAPEELGCRQDRAESGATLEFRTKAGSALTLRTWTNRRKPAKCASFRQFATFMSCDIRTTQPPSGADAIALEQCPATRGAERRERLAKNAARRRAQWLQRNWKTSAKGNAYLKTDGFIITIFQDGSAWKACVADSVSDRKRFSYRTFGTQDRAKLAAFDAMVRFKPEWRSSR